MRRKAEHIFWFLVENVPPLLTVGFAAYVLVQSQRATLKEMEILLWLLAIVGLLATSELVERFRRLRRIEAASLKTLDAVQAMVAPNIEGILRYQVNLESVARASRAREIWACGYSLVNLLRRYETFFAERLEHGCNFRFLLLKPDGEASNMLDGLMTPRPGELKSDIENALARIDRIEENVSAPTKGHIARRLLKTVPSCSLLIVDPGLPHGWVQVGVYPSYYNVPLDTGRPHLVLTDSEGYWYKFFCQQFERLWNDPHYSEPYAAERPSSTSEDSIENSR